MTAMVLIGFGINHQPGEAYGGGHHTPPRSERFLFCGGCYKPDLPVLAFLAESMDAHSLKPTVVETTTTNPWKTLRAKILLEYSGFNQNQVLGLKNTVPEGSLGNIPLTKAR